MKLQLALDDIGLQESLVLLDSIKEYIDIIEIGTPFLIRDGVSSVRIIKETFPTKEVLADAKIMDAGRYEAELCFYAGADYVTVLGVTDLSTVKECVKLANELNKKIVIDMICVNDMPEKIRVLENIGVHGLAVHTGVDQQEQGRTPLDDLVVMKQYVKNSEISVAGGINANNIHQYITYKPEVVIVGSGICNAKNPKDEALKIYKQINEVDV